MSNTEQRAAFEKWHAEHGYGDHNYQGKPSHNNEWFYFDEFVDASWNVWLAALSAQSALQEPVARVINKDRCKETGYPINARVETIGDFDLEHIADGTLFYTHPSSAAQVEEIRNAALEEATLICEKLGDEYNEREGMKYPELRTDAVGGCRDCESAIRALKTRAPSKGEGS